MASDQLTYTTNQRERHRRSRKPKNNESENKREYKENENPSNDMEQLKSMKGKTWVDEVQEFVPLYHDEDDADDNGEELKQISLGNGLREESWAESRKSGKSKKRLSVASGAKNSWIKDDKGGKSSDEIVDKNKQKYGMSALVSCNLGEVTLTLEEEAIVCNEINSNKTQTIPYSLIFHARKRRKFERINVSYAEESDQILKEENIDFDFSDTGSAKKWIRYINRFAASKSRRPKNIRIYVASRDGMVKLESIALPLLESFEVKHTLVSVLEKSDINLDVENLNLEEYDALVMIGGDEAVHTLISGLLNRSQPESLNMKKSQFAPFPAKLPVSIWPAGFHNDIAFSIMGNVDFKTAVLHLLLGHRSTPDISSVHNREKLMGWSFNNQYGFGATVQKNFLHTKGNKERKYEASVVKAIGKSQFLPYDCNIEYLIDIQHEEEEEDDDLSAVKICSRGCSVCEEATARREKEKEGQSNQIHEVSSLDDFNEDSDNDRNSVLELRTSSKWMSIKGQFIWVGIYTIPCRSDLAVQGLSKNCHLQDGNMDLILVKDCTRKEFLQFFRRLGNRKNQTDLPFVEYYRVKSVRFRPRKGITWQHRNTNITEIDYHLQSGQDCTSNSPAASAFRRSSFMETISLTDTNSIGYRENSFNEIEVIDDQLTDNSSDSESEDIERNKKVSKMVPCKASWTLSSPVKGKRQKASPTPFVIDNLCDDDCSLDGSDYNIVKSADFYSNSSLRGSNTELGKPPISGLRRLSASLGLIKKRESSDAASGKPPIATDSKTKEKIKKKMKTFRKIFKTTEAGSLPPPDYIQPSTTPAERAAQRKLAKENYKESKKKLEMEEKLTSSWMLDYNLIDENELDISVHSGLIEIFGKGISKGSKIPENKMLWLSMA